MCQKSTDDQFNQDTFNSRAFPDLLLEISELKIFTNIYTTFMSSALVPSERCGDAEDEVTIHDSSRSSQRPAHSKELKDMPPVLDVLQLCLGVCFVKFLLGLICTRTQS